MELSEEREIAAPPGIVWAGLMNPEVLKACIPGCESMAGSPANGFEAVVVQKVGPVKARFTGVVTLSDIAEGKSCTISGEGKGGPAGFAKGRAKVTLTPSGTGTTLAYKVEANVGGKIAQLGSRLIDVFARKLADEFFDRFKTTMEGEQPAAEPAMAEAVLEGGDPALGGAPKKGWFRRLIGG
ncbi:CoxG family protein [Tabrizicola sp.]|uniref:CoxG family protein n=1 Tax=Tabrizicola sp. TaxID=2005166 RepID=UPI003F353EC2